MTEIKNDSNIIDTPPSRAGMEEATQPVYHSSGHSTMQSNSLESDTVKLIDFDGVGIWLSLFIYFV